MSIRRDIQSLRGIAVILVVLFHAWPEVFTAGYLGVDIFFVISGFLIMPKILQIFENGFTFTKMLIFFKRRYMRLAPALGAVAIFSAFLIFFLGNINDHLRFYKQVLASLTLTANFVAHGLSGDYFNPNPNPFIHTWSLSAEGQIYIFIPILLAIILKILDTKLRQELLVIILVSTCAFGLLFINLIPYEEYFYSPAFRIIQFSLGGLVYFLSASNLKSQNTIVNLSIIICSIIILFLAENTNSVLLGLITSFLTCVIILTRKLELLTKTINRPLSWIGDRSYSIYLIHMPVLYISYYSPLIEFQPTHRKFLLTFIAVLLTFVLGNLLYKSVESRYRGKQFLNSTSNKLDSNLIKVFILSTITPIALALVMLFSYSKDYFGLIHSRVPTADKDLIREECSLLEKVEDTLCYSKVPSANKVLILIGDSHAEHYAYSIYKLTKFSNMDFIILNDPDTDSIDFGTVNALTSNYDTAFLIYSRRWDLNLIKDHQSNILLLNRINAKLLVIGNNPEFPDLTLFMNQRSIFTRLYDPPKQFHISKMDSSVFSVNQKLFDFLNSNNISYLDPKSIFCTSFFCTRYKNGSWLYFDDNHLSAAGSQLVIPKIQLFLSKH
jgi:peptidoglycan/LPS O-acetylase OafA/YrhL